MIFYEFLYTSIGQAIAAYAPNEYFAAIMNPVILGAGLISFCGVVVPYASLPVFWVSTAKQAHLTPVPGNTYIWKGEANPRKKKKKRYWMYYLDPFTYLVGGLLGEVLWDMKVKCEPSELIQFAAPAGQTCGAYMAEFINAQTGYLVDGSATQCEFCQYSTGADYAKTFNLREKYYAWRDVSFFFFFSPWL